MSHKNREPKYKSWLSDSFYRVSGDQRTRSQSIYSLYLLYVTPPGDNFCENVQFYVCQFCVKQWVSESYCPTQPDSMHTVFSQKFSLILILVSLKSSTTHQNFFIVYSSTLFQTTAFITNIFQTGAQFVL